MNEQAQSNQPEISGPYIEETENGVIIYVEDVICDELINPIIQCIVSLNINRPDLEHITLFIDSPGGDVKSAMKLIDMMDMSRIHIRTIGWGAVSSAALLIFMCGHERLLSNSVQVLSHQATLNVNSLSAKLNDFESQQKEFQNICDRLVSVYVKRTGMSVKDIKNKLMRHHDVWLTSDEALEFNMADDHLHNHAEIFWQILGGKTKEDISREQEQEEQTVLEG